MTTFEVSKVAITILAQFEGVSEVRALVYLFSQVFHKELKENRVGVGVKHSDLLTEGAFEKRV